VFHFVALLVVSFILAELLSKKVYELRFINAVRLIDTAIVLLVVMIHLMI